jgi:hypothetical protein
MASHRIVNYFRRLLVASLAIIALAASEHHGVVKSNGIPVPGATVTASQGDTKPLVTTTDDNGAYEFADLPDGIWTITVDLLGFSTLSREVGVTADAGSPTWDLKVQSLDALNNDLAAEAAKRSGASAAPATVSATVPASSDKAAPPATPTTPKPAAKPPLRDAQQGLPSGRRGFQRLDVNASGDQADTSAGGVDLSGGDINQSASEALVVGGSVSDALGMQQQPDWGFGGRGGEFGGPGGINGDGIGGPGSPGGFGGRGSIGGFGGGRGGGVPGERGERGGRARTNSFGNGRRNPRNQYTGNLVFTLDNSIWDAQAYSLTGAETPIRVGKKDNLDIRFDSTNLLNHRNYTGYNMTVGGNQFGLPIGVNTMRAFTITVRFHF